MCACGASCEDNICTLQELDEYDAEAAAEAAYFDRLERRDEIMGFYDFDPPDPYDD